MEERIIPKMNAAFKPIWLAALRGGKYTQGKGYLVVPDKPVSDRRTVSADSLPGSMCCLGVLRDAVPELRALGSEELSFLNEAQAKLAGIDRVQNDLATFNDGDGRSFAQIADWIETNL